MRTSEAFETVSEKVNMALTALTLDWAQGWVARVGNGRQLGGQGAVGVSGGGSANNNNNKETQR